MAVRAAACAAAAWIATIAAPAAAQLRIVDYNIAQNSKFTTEPATLNTILTAIGEEIVNGFARPIDVLANQELAENGSETAFIVAQLNSIYGAGVYAVAPVPLDAVTGGAGLPSLIYNTQTVTLLETIAFGNVGSGTDQQPRSTLRYTLRPVGYDAAADFYIYNSHYKSDDGTSDQARRLVEATSIRENADALGEGVHALYVGDYNIRGSGEAMYQHLLSPGPGQAFDPLGQSSNNGNPVTWSNNADYRGIHTQSPIASSDPMFPYFSGQVGGGMNDRYDFQLTTAELLDDEGMSVIAGSYRTFGNNGMHSLHGSITSGTGAAPAVLTALKQVSDHLPVVVDYQLPAKMYVQVASIPETVGIGSISPVGVMVQNVAEALVAAGADELDYTLSVTGDLIGSLSATAATLGPANMHEVLLSTSTPGFKSGTINVTATSQGAAMASFSMPVSFTVVGAGGGVVHKVIARDDFDAPLNRIDFSQSPEPGTFTNAGDGFQRYQVVPEASIPFQLVDDSTSGAPTDAHGIINRQTKLDGWFGVTDTVNNDNPSGAVTATWQFDISGALNLDVSIDMGACGDFENADVFDWTYSIDGGEFLPLFISDVAEGGSATYTFAAGHQATYADPLTMQPIGGSPVQLSNVMTTLTSAIPGNGNVLTVRLQAVTDGGEEAYAFDNIVVRGDVFQYLEADFDENGFVDASDLATWRTNLGTPDGASKGDGDADADGDVDGFDFLVWQRQNTLSASVIAGGGAVPEPGGWALAALGAVAWGGAARRGSRRGG